MFFLVYGLEEDGSPPWEGDGVSAKFIGELVHQEILCSYHQVVIATHTLRGVLSVFVRELRTYAYPQYFSIDPVLSVFVLISDHRIIRVMQKNHYIHMQWLQHNKYPY